MLSTAHLPLAGQALPSEQVVGVDDRLFRTVDSSSGTHHALSVAYLVFSQVVIRSFHVLKTSTGAEESGL